MVTIISIVIIITALSLYDYFSTKSWQLITSSERNDAVFEKRNKKYGAYQIRTDYNKRLLLILFFVTAGIGGLWGGIRLFSNTLATTDVNKITKEWIIDVFDDKKVEDIIEIPEPKPEAPVQSIQKTVEFRTLVVTDQVDVKPIDIVDNTTKVGLENTDGDGKDVFTENPNLGKGTGGEKTIEVEKDKTFDVVDEKAIFPGGYDALRKYIAENIDLSLVDGKSIINLRFVVDTEGNVSSVEVTRNTEGCKSCERAAVRVIKSMPKWTPGKVNGKPVKSYYRMPINIQ